MRRLILIALALACTLGACAKKEVTHTRTVTKTVTVPRKPVIHTVTVRDQTPTPPGHRCWWVRVPQGDASVQGLSGMSREQIEDEFEKMEAAAEVLERAPHIEKTKDYEQEEIALSLRRTPSSGLKTKAIKVARKQLNK